LDAGANYTIAFTGADFAITAATLTVTADENQSKVYGATDPALTFTATGFANGDTQSLLTGALARATGENVGTYAINQGNLSAGANYTIVFTGADFEITVATLTVTVDADQSKVYGATDPALTFTAMGFVNNDNQSLLTGALARAAGEDVGTYAINRGTLDAGANYTIAFTGADFAITVATLTVTVDENQSKVYGATDPALTFTATGFVNNDTQSLLTGALVRETGEDVGTYAINQGDLSAGANYTVAFTGADFEITKKALTITADNKQRAFGEANPTLTFTYEGLVNGDTRIAVEPSISTEADIDSRPGEYPIVLSGGSDANYEITRINGILRVELTSLGQVRNLTAESGDRTVLLGWEAPELGSELVEGYLLERSEDGSVFGKAEEVRAEAFTVTGLSNNQPYWFRVRAFGKGVRGDEKIIGPITPLALYSDVSGRVPVKSPGLFGLLIDEKETAVDLELSEGGVLLRAPGLTMELESFRASGDRLASIGGILVLEPGGTAAVRGEGFRSGTRVSVWLIGNVEAGPNDRIAGSLPYLETRIEETENGWSEQSRLLEADAGAVYFLGFTDVDVSGTFSEVFDIPADIIPGSYTLQASGITASGSPLVLSIGAVLPSDVELDSEGDGVPDFVAELSVDRVIPVSLETVWGDDRIMASLPSEVLVSLPDGSLRNVGVIWEAMDISELVLSRGTYSFEGELVLPVGILNAFDRRALLELIVLPKAAPQDVQLISSSFRADAQRLFYDVSGIRVIDPVDDIHTITLLGDGFDNRFFEIKQNILFWNSADHAPGRTEFTVHVRVRDRDGNEIDRLLTVNRERSALDQIAVYNTFTPNGDGKNDSWGVPDLRFYSGVQIVVMERSGQRVFSTDNPDRRWDGTSIYNGRELPVGTYYWIIEVKETGEVRRGMLNLLRK